MAEQGESYVKYILESQGYKTEKVGMADVFGTKENLGIVIEEKDFKDPASVIHNKIYVRGIDGKMYYQDRSQVVRYGYNIKKNDMQKGIYRFIICAFVYSKLEGRKVQPIFFQRFGTIFVISKEYFPIWLASIEKTYLGIPSLIDREMYMGGK